MLKAVRNKVGRIALENDSGRLRITITLSQGQPKRGAMTWEELNILHRDPVEMPAINKLVSDSVGQVLQETNTFYGNVHVVLLFHQGKCVDKKLEIAQTFAGD